MRRESPDTYKICPEIGNSLLAAGDLNEGGMRRIKQLGVKYVFTTGPKIPRQESGLQSIMIRH